MKLDHFPAHNPPPLPSPQVGRGLLLEYLISLDYISPQKLTQGHGRFKVHDYIAIVSREALVM